MNTLKKYQVHYIYIYIKLKLDLFWGNNVFNVNEIVFHVVLLVTSSVMIEEWDRHAINQQ